MNLLQPLKKLYIVIYKYLLNLIYKTFSLFLKDDTNKVVIALYRSQKVEGNLEFIYKEIIEQLPNAKIHLVFAKNKMNLRLFKEVISLSNARYLILDDYYLPIYLIKPNRRLKVVQLWHAAGAFKKFGYSTVGTKFGPDYSYLKLVPIHSNYTHVYVSTNKIVDFYAEAFNMSPTHIFPLGLPRIDLFREVEKCELIRKSIYSDNPPLQNIETVKILIAPTYRAKGTQVESTIDIINSVIKISSLINNDIRIIFKAHPYTDIGEINRLKRCPNVLIAQNYSINEWMLVSDAFITDYSSAIFEFSLLQRPMAHFVPDINEYKQNRGLYQDVEMISDGKILFTPAQLVEWINDRKSNEFFDSTRMVHYNFDNTRDVSKKIVNHFIS